MWVSQAEFYSMVDFLWGRYALLGDLATRESLRRFFEVDRHFIALAALKALADDGGVPREKVAEAIALYGIDPEKQNPAKV